MLQDVSTYASVRRDICKYNGMSCMCEQFCGIWANTVSVAQIASKVPRIPGPIHYVHLQVCKSKHPEYI